MISAKKILSKNLNPYGCAFGFGLVGAIALQPILAVQALIFEPPQAQSIVSIKPIGSIRNSSLPQENPSQTTGLSEHGSALSKGDKKPRSSQESTHLQPTSSYQIRVRIAHHPNQIEIATSSAAAIAYINGGEAGQALQPMTRYRAQVNSQGIQLGNLQLQNGIVVNPGPEGFVLVNNRWYRGQLALIYAEGELLAINWIDLEHYLYSVVGSEMPSSWHPDALRAQAIAARSYALIHISRPASPWFDLGDNERWQAYNGVESEAGSTYAAVSDTTGQVLTQNGQILETLYAATQDITDAAHDGFGMSQYGAEALANGGRNYQQILANYYPGSVLVRLRG